MVILGPKFYRMLGFLIYIYKEYTGDRGVSARAYFNNSSEHSFNHTRDMQTAGLIVMLKGKLGGAAPIKKASEVTVWDVAMVAGAVEHTYEFDSDFTGIAAHLRRSLSRVTIEQLIDAATEEK